MAAAAATNRSAKRSRPNRFSLAALALTAVAAAGPARGDPAAIARGAYLAAAAGCDQCHTDKEHGGAPYAGGRRLKTEFGTLTTPNITPDPVHGIGRWRMADFAAALRRGIAPDDTHYLPVFPFPFYARLDAADLADLKAFLDSVPPAPTANRGADGLAAIGRTRAAAALALSPPGAVWQPDPAHDAVWNRGAYLVATVGRCGDCHTPRDLAGRPLADRFLAGNHARKAPNITPDEATGIGKWSEDDVLSLLTDGMTPDGDFVGDAMTEIVRNTSRLSDADRHAIAAYLRTVPPRVFVKKR